eukprot:3726824-Rhodomonas_salina.1
MGQADCGVYLAVPRTRRPTSHQVSRSLLHVAGQGECPELQQRQLQAPPPEVRLDHSPEQVERAELDEAVGARPAEDHGEELRGAGEELRGCEQQRRGARGRAEEEQRRLRGSPRHPHLHQGPEPPGPRAGIAEGGREGGRERARPDRAYLCDVTLLVGT